MKLKEMLEILKETHPTQNNQNLIKMLNRASDDFCRKTGVIKNSTTISTEAGQRYYTLSSSIIEINRVDVDDKMADKLIGQPEETDIT